MFADAPPKTGDIVGKPKPKRVHYPREGCLAEAAPMPSAAEADPSTTFTPLAIADYATNPVNQRVTADQVSVSAKMPGLMARTKNAQSPITYTG